MTIEANVSLRILTPRQVLEGSGNPNALENVNPAQLPDGCLCWVISEAALYRYEAEGIESRAYPDIIPTCYGEGTKGRWRRTIQDAAPSTSVNCCATADVNLLAPVVSFDTHLLIDNDRVLLPFQTDQTENGIYSWDAISGLLTRADDFDTGEEFVPGLIVSVTQGDQYLGADFRLVNTAAVVLGVTDILFGLSSGILLVDRFGVTIARHDQLQVIGAALSSAGQENVADFGITNVLEFGNPPTASSLLAALESAVGASLTVGGDKSTDYRRVSEAWVPPKIEIITDQEITVSRRGFRLHGPRCGEATDRFQPLITVNTPTGNWITTRTGGDPVGDAYTISGFSLYGLRIQRTVGGTLGYAIKVQGVTDTSKDWAAGIRLSSLWVQGFDRGFGVGDNYGSTQVGYVVVENCSFTECNVGIDFRTGGLADTGTHLSPAVVRDCRIRQNILGGLWSSAWGLRVEGGVWESQPSPIWISGSGWIWIDGVGSVLGNQSFSAKQCYFENIRPSTGVVTRAGTGNIGETTITLTTGSNAKPGMKVTGTGVGTDALIVSRSPEYGSGVTVLTMSVANDGAVSGDLTLDPWGLRPHAVIYLESVQDFEMGPHYWAAGIDVPRYRLQRCLRGEARSGEAVIKSSADVTIERVVLDIGQHAASWAFVRRYGEQRVPDVTVDASAVVAAGTVAFGGPLGEADYIEATGTPARYPGGYTEVTLAGTWDPGDYLAIAVCCKYDGTGPFSNPALGPNGDPTVLIISAHDGVGWDTASFTDCFVQYARVTNSPGVPYSNVGDVYSMIFVVKNTHATSQYGAVRVDMRPWGTDPAGGTGAKLSNVYTWVIPADGSADYRQAVPYWDARQIVANEALP